MIFTALLFSQALLRREWHNMREMFILWLDVASVKNADTGRGSLCRERTAPPKEGRIELGLALPARCTRCLTAASAETRSSQDMPVAVPPIRWAVVSRHPKPVQEQAAAHRDHRRR